MPFAINETVEICKKQEGLVVLYHTATILAAIGKNRYMVRYKNLFADDKTRLKTDVLDASEIRPLPPDRKNFKVSDKVDAYVNNVWWVGTITRKVDPNYHVKLDISGKEVHCAFFNIRIHLEFEEGKWAYNGTRPQNAVLTGEKEALVSASD